MYVCERCAEGIFVYFPWWLKNVKSRSKIALFQIWFPKKKIITFFRRKLSKLHKKDTILHVSDNYIFPKTRANKNEQWTHLGNLKNFIVSNKEWKIYLSLSFCKNKSDSFLLLLISIFLEVLIFEYSNARWFDSKQHKIWKGNLYLNGHWTTSASSPWVVFIFFFKKRWNFYSIRSVYLHSHFPHQWTMHSLL